MTARRVEGDPIALRTDPAGDDPFHVRTVHGDEGADAILVTATLEQVPHAAQVAGAFLAHIGNEQNIRSGLDPRRVHRALPCQQNREAAGVVANARRKEFVAFSAHFHVRPGGKHRIEMRRDADQRTIADAAANPGDISLGVGFQIGQPVRPGHVEPRLRTHRFAEGRRFDFGQADDVRHRSIMFGCQRRGGAAERIATIYPLDRRLGVVGHGAGP